MPFVLSAFADEAGPTCGEQIKALKQAGIQNIDIRNIDGYNICVLPVGEAKRIKYELSVAGITVAMYGSPIGKIDIEDDFAIDLTKLKHLGALAPILGCRAVRIFSYYNKSNKPSGDFRREVISRLKQLKALAKDLGLVLYHENEGRIFGEKADGVLTIAKELREELVEGGGGGAFRMIFDFGNFNACQEDVWEDWQKLAGMTDAFHLKDNEHSRDGKYHHVPVGYGGGQVHAIMADAVKRKVPAGQVPVTIEPHLKHSAAVLATGPGGVANQAYSKMTGNESFQIACRAAKEVLVKAGAEFI